MRRLSRVLLSIGGWSLVLAAAEAAAGPADSLYKLVPPDAGATLAVENLRTRTREVGSSPLIASLRRLPMVQGWLRSERFRQLERLSAEIETALGVPFSVIRDELIGDAVVLVYQPGPGNAPELARGLLLASPRDRPLMVRLVDSLNANQRRSGELTRLDKKGRRGLEYIARNFKPGTRLAEFYAHLDDGTFAWSNSEALIHGVIDRKVGGGPSLKENSAFLGVRSALPDKALASLFVNPRLVERTMAASIRPIEPGQERVLAALGRYLAAVGYAGLALEWRDGPVLHLHESLDPTKLDPWLKAWLSHPPAPAGWLGQVPETALAVLAAHVDFEAVRGALWDLVPDDDRPGLDNYRQIFQGLLLGLDPNTEILPRLRPGVLAYIEARPEIGVRPLFPIVGAVGWSDQPGEGELSPPIDNALRTALAAFAIDPARKARHLRIESRKVGEARSTELTDGATALFAYRVDPDGVVLGNAAEAVARFGSAKLPSAIREVRKAYFPEAETYAVVDLIRLVRVVRTYRGAIAGQLATQANRPLDDLDRDLGQWLALADLFRAVAFTSASKPDASAIHRTFSLIVR